MGMRKFLDNNFCKTYRYSDFARIARIITTTTPKIRLQQEDGTARNGTRARRVHTHMWQWFLILAQLRRFKEPVQELHRRH